MERFMNPERTIPSSDEAWELGDLGRSESYVAVADDDIEAKVDESLDLQLISIRLQKSLIEDFKLIGQLHGIGYQPLMRQILQRFADCEKKRILRELASEREEKKKRQEERAAATASSDDRPTKRRAA
jgi:hypothetical protein